MTRGSGDRHFTPHTRERFGFRSVRLRQNILPMLAHTHAHAHAHARPHTHTHTHTHTTLNSWNTHISTNTTAKLGHTLTHSLTLSFSHTQTHTHSNDPCIDTDMHRIASNCSICTSVFKSAMGFQPHKIGRASCRD